MSGPKALFSLYPRISASSLHQARTADQNIRRTHARVHLHLRRGGFAKFDARYAIHGTETAWPQTVTVLSSGRPLNGRTTSDDSGEDGELHLRVKGENLYDSSSVIEVRTGSRSSDLRKNALELLLRFNAHWYVLIYLQPSLILGIAPTCFLPVCHEVLSHP